MHPRHGRRRMDDIDSGASPLPASGPGLSVPPTPYPEAQYQSPGPPAPSQSHPSSHIYSAAPRHAMSSIVFNPEVNQLRPDQQPRLSRLSHTGGPTTPPTALFNQPPSQPCDQAVASPQQLDHQANPNAFYAVLSSHPTARLAPLRGAPSSPAATTVSSSSGFLLQPATTGHSALSPLQRKDHLYETTRPYPRPSAKTAYVVSAIPYIPGRPAPAPAAPLPEPPAAASRRPFCDRIHNVTWAVARAFGFQAFNAAPAPGPSRWVPATAFLAADHLEALLVRNILPRLMMEGEEQTADLEGLGREGQGQERRQVAFARAVWDLHSHIFLSYEGAGGWCRLVGLSARPSAAESELLSGLGAASPDVLHLLLCELALYFLLYSEAANLRHTPELMWFLFWAANHSPAMEGLWRQGMAPVPEQQLDNARQRRLQMRNELQAPISAARELLGHDPAACRPHRCVEAAADLAARLPALLPHLGLPSTASSSDACLSCAPSRSLFCDLVCHGDGGSWLDLVVAPLFTVMAFEGDLQASAGMEVAHRLGYDDINESMCSRRVVSRLLGALGVAPEAAAGGQVHGALEALTRLGYPAASPLPGAGNEAPAAAAAAASDSATSDPRLFDPVLAAAFWADTVFVKTHRERRSWLSLLRAFYRVYSLQLVLLHATMALAFAPGSLTALSSAVITHAAVAAVERTANWWLSRGTRDPLQAARARDSWATEPAAGVGAPAGAPEGGKDAETGEAQQQQQQQQQAPLRSRLSDGGAVEARQLRRRAVAVEGAPVCGVFGWLEWVVVAAAMLGLFALQYMGPPALRPLARSYWPLAAGGYVAAVAVHGLLTTRDGYCVSLSSWLRLPGLFTASSQRPAAGCWLERPMAVGWRAAALTALFWLQVLAAKAAFDYYVILRPMAGQVRLILHRNWLGCSGRYSLFGSELPLRCQDADWLLVGLRVAPFVLVCLVDTQIFYQLVLMAWGLVHGLVALNLGIAGSWEALRAEFHRAPIRWWTRCMSEQGTRAARAAAAAAQRRRREAAAGPGPRGGSGSEGGSCCSDDEDGSEYGSEYSSLIGGIGGAFCRHSSFGSLSSLGRSSGGQEAGAGKHHHHLHQKRQGGQSSSPPAASGSPHALSSGGGDGDGGSGSSASSSDGTSKTKAKKGGRASSPSRDTASVCELVSMLAGQGDEPLAQWMAFAAAWDAVVDDLRSCDLLSDRERENLVFTRLPAAATAMAVGAAGAEGTPPAAGPSSPDSPSGGDADSSFGGSSSSGQPASASASPRPRSLRPILLPAFFYAGVVQRVVDTGSASPSQQLVLGELRAMMVWLGCQLGLMDGAQAAALLAAPCCAAALDVAHTRSREKGLAALRSLLAAMQGLTEPLPPAGGPLEQAVRRRQALYGEAAEALEGVLAALEVEGRAVVKARLGVKKGGRSRKGGSEAAALAAALAEGGEEVDPQAAAVALMEAVAALRRRLVGQPGRLSSALALLHPENRAADGTPPSADSSPAAPGRGPLLDLPLLRRVLSTASKMLNLSAAAAQPSGAEARRILGFFVTSLANRQLSKPGPVAAMASWTVLTPLYAEDVMFPLEARQVAEALGMGPSASSSAALPDLLTETEDRVSLMAYLRSMFPKDWDNFKERLGRSLVPGAEVDLAAATEADFAEGGPLREHGLALQLWASYRGQLLARTVRGMAAYGRALRVLAALECPRPAGVGRREHVAAVEDVAEAKFCHVIAAQLYGVHRRSSNLRERWLAESIDLLLEAFQHLRVSYLDTVPVTTKAGVPPAVAGASSLSPPPPAHQFAVLIRGRRHHDVSLDGRTEELYRVRLPYNRYSKRGVILGEGKPENQNHAVIFCFGEAIQTIDMNQDNALAEALKMRNLLAELQPERDTRAAKRAEAELREAVAAVAEAGGPASGPAPPTAPAAAAAPASLPPAAEYKRLLTQLRSAERPVAVVGFREWVFSDKAGALGTFAASSEFAFSTMMQRTLAFPANVRLHYGHPDAFNKLFVMTRGGVSKATRQLHVSEDVFGGMNHSLRGGRIKFREYVSVGKGRDMGFDSINAFESKISAGFGEVALSRDLLRMATRLDLWRCLHLYHSLAGNYFNTWLVMGSVYAHVYALLFFALARAAVYRTTIYFPSPPPPPPGTPMVPPLAAGAPSPPPGVVREELAYDTIRVEHVLQLGLLSLLPYVAEMALEHGLVRGLLAALAQVVSGSFSFFIFKQQTTTTALHRSMLYGGATYVATGRGFSITSSSFIQLFSNYGRSHIALGFELGAMAVAVAATNDCARCSYAGLTWGTWLAALSLVLAPCWFNPMAFSAAKVRRDMHAWAAWLRGEADRDSGLTWHQWNRRQLAASRDEAGGQTDRWLNVVQSLVLKALPPALLALAAASRLSLRLSGLPAGLLPPPLAFLRTSSWALFFAASGAMWAVAAAALSAARRFHALSDRRRWRLWSFWVAAGGIAFLVVFLVGLSRWYSGSGAANLALLLYANANLLLAVHRAAEHLAPRSRAARRLVDGGYWLLDCCLGWLLLGLLGALSLAGVVGRIQTTLLFNVTFARSVRRGSLVKTIGTAKAERRQQEALVGMMVADGDAGSVAGAGAGSEGGGAGGRRGPRLQLQT